MSVPTSALVVPDLLRLRAEQLPAREAINVRGLRTITYGDWDARSNAVAHGLLARIGGRGRGVRVALLYSGDDWIDYAIAYFGVLKAGATAMHVNDSLPVAELERRFAQCEVVGVIHGAPITWEGTADRWSLTTADLDSGDHSAPEVDIRPVDIADILYTSGTTGPAKPFTNPHGTPTYGRGSAALGTLDDTAPLLAPMPMGTTSSSTTVAVLATTTPSPLIVCSPDDPEELARLVAEHGCGTVILTPWTAIRLMAIRPHERYDLSSVKSIGNASAPMPPRIARELLRAMPNAVINSAYAQSEAVPAIMLGTVDPDRPMSVGRVGRGTEMVVVDEHGDPVPTGELGEIWLRSEAPKRLYLDPGLNEKVHAGGWTRTRDLGRATEDGELFLFDRKVDAITTSGRLVSSLEVEAAVYEHPAVREATVIGLPDEERGQAVTAVVVLDGTADDAELLGFLARRLEPHQVPARIHRLPALPRGGTGKVLKFELRRTLARNTPYGGE
ncbi:class I adenylate-forming enzyme family protein [Actinosynnema sp. NPDC047251]|uniref:AMP-dependent synthetase and ligase n=1 Tax=Saccharothrix espanaensis (strain ATCC 51144 / DSM 44229 / JCM 9112 / NBRC 15066 / NRRL 15764) TaxID=1179773 RepID=K0K5R0_SACES|nr:class I adenylate-forming enzyme family protein [Saccharothrix espanaensis]CCH31903.1 AMP-dependent synthetase and ligase [Saccharothrix espanaensis DSM 44229]